MQILVFNCGSSSIKFAVVDSASGVANITGLAERLGEDGAVLHWKHPADDQRGDVDLAGGDHKAAARAIVEVLDRFPAITGALGGVGHRVVHGGEHFSDSTLADDAVVDTIERCNSLAPLHNPVNVLGLRVAREVFSQLPHVAVFDTAFHQTMPRQAYLYGVPYEWYEELGVRRYGFHGTSHRYVAEQAAIALGKRISELNIITAHLGNGSSCAAVRGGRCVDTTMGLTPLEGLIMGTRSGDVDPSIFGFLNDAKGWDIATITKALNKQSGLLGLSGCSNDMRTLVGAAAEGNERAQIAIDCFCYRLARQIGAIAVGLPSIDALVFTGGIGENNADPIRKTVLAHLAVLGFVCDDSRNPTHGADCQGRITTDESTCALVIETNEELQIARESAQVIAAK